ncbi:MAG: hypothetical protein AB1298_08290, partial [Bacteroidota bacterium]
TVPLLENVNRSIKDSTNKIPKAALQINSVTNATEVATTEILDIVDGMSADIQTMKPKLESLKTRLSGDEDVESLLRMTEKIQEGMMNITLSLQVQDITAQQLSSVNHLIESIQEKLSSLIMDLNNKEIHETDYHVPKNASFNPDARYEKNNGSQELADSLINETVTKTSQEEIDKLFAK